MEIHHQMLKIILKTDFIILPKDTPLLEAIKIVIKEEVILVQEKDKSLSGIVTIADISSILVLLGNEYSIMKSHMFEFVQGMFCGGTVALVFLNIYFYINLFLLK